MSKELVKKIRWLGDFLESDAESKGNMQGSQGASYCWDSASLIEAQAAQIESLHKALTVAINHYADVGSEHWNMFDAALSITPSDALQQVKDRVREECAVVCEKSDRYRGEYFAGKICDLKGQP